MFEKWIGSLNGVCKHQGCVSSRLKAKRRNVTSNYPKEEEAKSISFVGEGESACTLKGGLMDINNRRVRVDKVA